MTVACGLPLFLVDHSPANITDTEYVDMYDRARIRVHCTLRQSDRTVLMVYNHGKNAPVACIEFGAAHTLSTVTITGKEPLPINDFLSRVSRSSRTRRFKASDGQVYTWTQPDNSDAEWQCLNSRSYPVSEYLVNPSTESSLGLQATVMVDEANSNLAGELVATLVIMRHIAKYNL